jgi:hypothetical protein
VTDFWTRKPANDWDVYWNTANAPHRSSIVDTLRALPAFSTLLEVGCGPGVNLWRILQAFPDVTVGGFDTSQVAIESGQARFAKAEQEGELPGSGDVWLAVGDLPASLSLVQPADVVLSCYACAYVPPERLHETLSGIATVAQQAIVLAEPMATPHAPPAKLTALPEWRHDYLAWFQEAAPGWQVTTLRHLEVDRMNRLLVAQRR